MTLKQLKETLIEGDVITQELEVFIASDVKEAVLELQKIIQKRINDTEITYCDDYDSGTLFAYDNILNDIKEIFGDFKEV